MSDISSAVSAVLHPASAQDGISHLKKTEAASSRRKKVALIATGGTIAGSGRPGKAAGYKAGELSVADILSSIPEAKDLADLELVEFCQKDSNDITRKDLLEMKTIIESMAARDDIDGIVITHGTDTLEESAFFLNLILHVEKPVIMTGAMRPATAASADGPMNLYQAIALACDSRAARMGVLAVFSDTIFSARDITKTNSIKTDAFGKSDHGIVGFMQDDRVFLHQSPYRRHTIYSAFSDMDISLDKKVEVFFVHQDCDPALLQFMMERYDGVVLSGTGSGNYPSSIQKLIENYDGDCTLVRSSRLLDGTVFDSKIFDPQNRCISSYRMPPHKAAILLQLGLSADMSREQLERLFAEY